MTRGQAQTLVFRFPDGGTILSDQPIREAERALAEAASARYVDEKRQEFDRAVEEHCARFGFDAVTGGLL